MADRRFEVNDERNSVIIVTDGTGANLGVNSYDDYGQPEAGNVGLFQYTGQMWLGAAGIYHYKARAYHPTLGRFLQPDPIGYGSGLNLYGYVGNDPINLVDPSGTNAGGGGGLLWDWLTNNMHAYDNPGADTNLVGLGSSGGSGMNRSSSSTIPPGSQCIEWGWCHGPVTYQDYEVKSSRDYQTIGYWENLFNYDPRWESLRGVNFPDIGSQLAPTVNRLKCDVRRAGQTLSGTGEKATLAGLGVAATGAAAGVSTFYTGVTIPGAAAAVGVGGLMIAGGGAMETLGAGMQVATGDLGAARNFVVSRITGGVIGRKLGIPDLAQDAVESATGVVLDLSYASSSSCR